MSRALLHAAFSILSLGVATSQLACVAPRDVPTTPINVPSAPDGAAGPTRAPGEPGAPIDAGPMTGGDGPAPGTPDPDPSDPAACAAGEQFCPGRGCVDPRAPEHCGRSCAPCPTIAGGMATCDGTKCGIACPTGLKPCLDKCIDLAAACDDACPPMQRACNGLCVDNTNVAACGPACESCPTSPNGKSACNGTSCELTCDAGYHLCEDGVCRSDRDKRTCGTSCTPCPEPEGGQATCDGTTCGTSCPSGTKLCVGACIPTNQACMGVCPQGRHDCGGNCVPNDVNFCGPACTQCRAPANADAKCTNDACTFTCRGGFRECGGECLANDRPCNGTCPGGTKVCGDRCVPSTTCCTDGREGCPQCNSCNGGTCTRQADGAGCGAGRTCRGGACVACGGAGQTCCGNSCTGGNLVCRGTCVACGGFGQPCCDNDRCGSELNCQGGTCRGECTPGQPPQCEGQTPKTCNGNGQLVSGAPCRDQTCVNGRGCTGQCAPGQRTCVGFVPQRCNNGNFVAENACAGQCVRDGQCEGECRGQVARCVGNTGGRDVCQGNDFVSANCPGPRTPGTGQARCGGQGTCDLACNSGRSKCNNNTDCCECTGNEDKCVDGEHFTCNNGSFRSNGKQPEIINGVGEFAVTCAGVNQVCMNSFQHNFGNFGPCPRRITARYRITGAACSDVILAFTINNQNRGARPRVGPTGAASADIDLGIVPPGGRMTITALGQEGGCNTGFLSSFGGFLDFEFND